jgi:hypothetical protein
MSRFSDEFVEANSSLDEAFGEPLEVRPIANGEFTRGALSGAAFTVVGILDLPVEVVRADGILDGAKSEIVAMKPTADFAASIFSDARPAPKEGDEIVALSRPGSPRFRVFDARPDGVSRIVCQLSPL